MKKWYVTATWDNWPDGGSYGAVVEAESSDDAEQLCLEEMAACRGEEDEPAEIEHDRYIVDCFPVADMIETLKGHLDAK